MDAFFLIPYIWSYLNNLITELRRSINYRCHDNLVSYHYKIVLQVQKDSCSFSADCLPSRNSFFKISASSWPNRTSSSWRLTSAVAIPMQTRTTRRNTTLEWSMLSYLFRIAEETNIQHNPAESSKFAFQSGLELDFIAWLLQTW